MTELRAPCRAATALHGPSTADGHTVEFPTSALRVGPTPRIEGPDELHVRSLVGAEVPPIVVHRSTLYVIDGVHRLRAALASGAAAIPVVLVDGDEHDMFVLAVQLNNRNGLPLTLADRRAAAGRVVASHPHWSDRMIADLTGLSPRSIAVQRTRSTPGTAHSNIRLGRDGTIRPLDVTAGRHLAARLMAERPGASLRVIAAEAGISLGTAQDVRRRIRAGLDPLPSGRRRPEQATPDQGRDPAAPGPVPPGADHVDRLLEQLRGDPSLRYSADGRAVLRLLAAHTLSEPQRSRLKECIPTHCAAAVSVLARHRAEAWLRFADEIGGFARSAPGA